MGLFDFLKKKQKKEELELGENLRKAVIELSDVKDENTDEYRPSGEFGYNIDNPVMVRNIVEGYHYLDTLECENNDPIIYSRLGSTMSDKLAHPIDIYEIINEKTNEIIGKIHIYGYGEQLSSKTPKGLKFK
ncbi:hypothetical protein LJB96_05645 [Methanobrevibacter sp. OttesenSCG-928-K11]|nr:hypothetical protein [Methanobrevibacter sp. OttesenSCG-928-K11]MDL2271360.1 hypothetical protein [Methanobrevibacter sp. OttesenSCG-928-I08]